MPLTLKKGAKRRGADRKVEVFTTAVLLPEPDNRCDPHAVAVTTAARRYRPPPMINLTGITRTMPS
jgi:hypothetical protein